MKGKKKTLAKKKAAKKVVTKKAVKVAKKSRKTATAFSLKKKKTAVAKKVKVLEIPPILLEGDYPSTPPQRGIGIKFALGPEPVKNHLPISEESFELPESYGTGSMYVTARDPYWIYAAWDLPTAKIKHYNKLSSRGSMTLRVYLNQPSGEPQIETPVYPHSRDWFVRVNIPGATYFIVLGYYDKKEQFNTVLISEPVKTLEPITAFKITQIERESITPFPQPSNETTTGRGDYERAGERTYISEGRKVTKGSKYPEISVEEQIQIASLVYGWRQQGSIELPILGKGQPQFQPAELLPALAGLMPAPSGQPLAEVPQQLGISSPKGAPEEKRKFWFNIQAELIVYGATEPDAQVTVGGNKIALRPDGTFTLRFSLPDGIYDVIARAVSKDGSDRRTVSLEFSRKTKSLEGEVGECKPPQKLPPPEIKK